MVLQELPLEEVTPEYAHKVYASYLGGFRPYPGDYIAELGRETRNAYYREYYAKKKKEERARLRGRSQGRKVSNALRAYDTMSWIQVLELRNNYQAYMRGNRPNYTTGDIDALREGSAYYKRVYRADRAKQLKFPEIRPMTLGYDPRLRRWPDGPITPPSQDGYWSHPAARSSKGTVARRHRTPVREASRTASDPVGATSLPTTVPSP